MPFIHWPGSTRDSNWRKDRQVACARSMNLLPAPVSTSEDLSDIGGRNRRFYLKPTPGFSRPASNPAVAGSPPPAVRGMLAAGDEVYVAAGDELYKIDADGAMARQGTVSGVSGARSSAEPVTMGWIGAPTNLLAVCANGKLAYFDPAKDPGEQFALDVRSDTSRLRAVAEFQNYFITLDDFGTVVVSPLRARTPGAEDPAAYNYDLTDFIQRGLTPDPWISMLALSDTLLLFGKKSFDVFELRRTLPPTTDGVAVPRLPITPVQGGLHHVGALHGAAAAVLGDTAYWVGRSSEGVLKAWRFDGGSVEPVSTPAVDEWLSRLDDPGALRCHASGFDGHRIFTVRSPASPAWCYDELSQMWHERGEWRPPARGAQGEWRAWQPEYAAAAAGRVWMASSASPSLRYLSADKRGFSDETIRRMRITPHLGDGNRLLRVVGVKARVGLDAGRVSVAVSRDGGATFGPLKPRRVTASKWQARGVSTTDGSAAAERRAGSEHIRWDNLGAGRDVAVAVVMDEGGGVLQDVLVDSRPLRE